jgi:predicted secreted acid phosphatase
MLSIRNLRRLWWTFIILTCLLSTSSLATEPVPPNDMLNAEVWMQTAIEYRANCLTIYALAKIRLDEALADKNWTAYDQTGDYLNLPPAVILDLDETALDNSPYEASLVVNAPISIRKPGATGSRLNRRRRYLARSNSPSTPPRRA